MIILLLMHEPDIYLYGRNKFIVKCEMVWKECTLNIFLCNVWFYISLKVFYGSLTEEVIYLLYAVHSHSVVLK